MRRKFDREGAWAVIAFVFYVIVFLFAYVIPPPHKTVSAETLATERYISEWIKLNPDQCIIQAHGLPARPMIVEVWVRPPVIKAQSSYPTGEVLPYVLFDIQLKYISELAINVCNYEDVAQYIQIVAED